ncbi:MAG: flagellar basal body rod protein FlgB [Lysinibacillus sp.]|nr:flagellar basal body rod protein FlgB [Lysinibacillus sp.]
MNLFGGTISHLEYGLKYSSLKTKTIAHNIANADTPNYKAKDVSFKKLLSEAKEKGISAYKTDERHYDFQIKQPTHGVYSYENFQYRHNGNGVDMDKEQAELAKNQIYYNALIDRINGKFNTLNTAIKGGR